MSLSATPTRRRLLFGALYFSEGAPIGFIWWALPTVLAAKGAPIEEITGFVSVLVWPWALKFLWAPLVDALRGPRWGHRAWILSSQFVMGATLLPMMFLDVQRDTTIVLWLLLAHAFAATVQDVAIDGWAIALTTKQEHGRINAAMATGKYVGRWLFGAGLLIVWDQLHPAVIFTSLTFCIWVTSAMVILSNDVDEPPAPLGVKLAQFGRSLRDAFTRRNTWLGVGIALISGAAFESLGAIAGPILIKLGSSTSEVGWWRTVWVAGLILGAWPGGIVSDRFGHRRCVIVMVLVLAAMVTGVALSPISGSVTVIALGIAAVNLGIGLFIATSYAMFMDLTDPRVGATQFSTFMGATNGCEAWAGAAGGALSRVLIFPHALFVMAITSLVSLPLLLMLRDREPAREGGAAVSSSP